MIKWGKYSPVFVALVAVLVLGAVALSGIGNPRDLDKERRAADPVNLKAAINAARPAALDPFEVEKAQMEADLTAREAAESAAMDQAKGEEPVRPTRPSRESDRNRMAGPNTILRPAVNYEPRTIFLQEDFETEIFPPTGWDSINTDPGYGWFLGTYSGGGTQCALVTWHAAGYQQDEWLITPMMDVSGAGSLLRLEFDMLKGYDYPHDFKVYVSFDGTAFTEIWDSYDVAYPTFTWYGVTVDLSAYAGGAPIWLGFQYYGMDADLFGLDNVVVTDDAPPASRCCYGEPTAPNCQDVTEVECTALGGNWSAGLNCTDNPCPVAGPNDNCAEVTPMTLPYTFMGNNEAATFDDYCQYFGDYPNVWIAFTITECSDITISYCNTASGWLNGWLNLVTDCACPEGSLISGATYDFGCPNGNANIYFSHLAAGTYYYPIMLDPTNGAIGDYVVDVTAEACPPVTPGDNCEDPFVVALSSADLPYTVAGQYTCGRINDYDATVCMGYYDGGEDLIVRVDVADAMFVNITLDPKGTTWSGMGISQDCTFATCLGFVGTGGGTAKTIYNVQLDPGSYYIMVDTWPTPDCIPELDIIFEEAPPPNPGDNCANPVKVDIPVLPFVDTNTTCGRINDYANTCLGSYDGGEDIIYEITALADVTVNFAMDPQGTTYTGFALAGDCAFTTCIGFVTGSATTVKRLTCVNLTAGSTYYLIVDTWPSPNCIPSFILTITDTTCAAIENDLCEDATEVGEVTDLPFSTVGTSHDGPTGCMTSPNIWFAYKPSAAGLATISLCGSEYDTRLGVYTGTCGALTQIGCDDDACDPGLQSVLYDIPVDPAMTYYVEVGGYSTNVGNGILNITLAPPCEFTCTGGTPEGEDCIEDYADDVTNGGCNMDVPVFGSIGPNEKICGTFSTYTPDGSAQYRDTDWYILSLDDWYSVTLSIETNFDAVFGWIEQITPGIASCDNITGYIAPYLAVGDCEPSALEPLTLAPGDYLIFVSGQTYTGFPCSMGPWEYALTATSVPAEPTPCAASGGCDEYISQVQIGTIDNSSDCTEYGDYTAISTDVEVGGSYAITVTNGSGYSSDQCGVWIDWNDDVVFDASEMVTLDVSTGVGPYTGTVVVPEGAVEGGVTMRVRIMYTGTLAPCGTTSYGEVEDYTLNVGGAAPTFMVAPDPILVLEKFALNPTWGDVYIGDGALPDGAAAAMENITVALGGCLVTVGVTQVIPGGVGEIPGDVMDVKFSLKEYVLCEEARQGGLIWDDIDSFFDVFYEIDGVPGTLNLQVVVRGHRSGDLNLDGNVNVTDLTMFVSYLFRGGDAPLEPAVANVDASPNQTPNVADLTYMIGYMFRGGPMLKHQ